MIGARFRRLSIRRKLVAVIMGTAAVVQLLASVGYLAVDYYRSRTDLLRDLVSQAQVVADNLQAAVQFEDTAAAGDTRRTLAPTRHVRTACVYRKDATLFAEFKARPDSAACPARPAADGYAFTRDRLQIAVPIEIKGERAGTVALRSDLDLVNTRLRIQAIVVAVLLVVALGVALVLSALLQSLVSDPITALARTAAEVSSRGD